MKHVLLRDNMRIAYQEWGSSMSANKIIALHGWLDNSNTFKTIGPFLGSIGYHCVAFDAIGHGRSSHLHVDAVYNPAKNISYLDELIDSFKWELPVNIVGHSMGAGISLLYSGAFPENVKNLILIEGMGPMSQSDKNAAKCMRKAIEAEKRAYFKVASIASVASSARDSVKDRNNNNNNNSAISDVVNNDIVTSGSISEGSSTDSIDKKSTRLYSNFEAAVQARINSVRTYPGKQSLSLEAAMTLVERGTYPVLAEEDELKTTEQVTAEAYQWPGSLPVRFAHDPKLVLPSHNYYTGEQVMSHVEAIQSKVLFISAENGWGLSKDEEGMFKNRLDVLRSKGLLTHHHLPGSHHLHLDPETSGRVIEVISSFLSL